MTDAKRCTKCGEVKALGEFSARWVNGENRRQSSCRSCSTAYVKAWRAVNPERQRATSRAYYAANTEACKRWAGAWKDKNPHKVAEYIARHHAAKFSSPAHEIIDRRLVWERDGGRCHICRKPCDPNAWHLDHIVPLARGGEHSYRNVAVSHPACNQRKGATGPAQARLLA